MNLDHKIGDYTLLMCYVFRLLLAQSYVLGIIFLMLSEKSSEAGIFFNWYTDMNYIFIIRHQVKNIYLMKCYQVTSVLPHALPGCSFSPHIYLYHSFRLKCISFSPLHLSPSGPASSKGFGWTFDMLDVFCVQSVAVLSSLLLIPSSFSANSRTHFHSSLLLPLFLEEGVSLLAFKLLSFCTWTPDSIVPTCSGSFF